MVRVRKRERVSKSVYHANTLTLRKKPKGRPRASMRVCEEEMKQALSQRDITLVEGKRKCNIQVNIERKKKTYVEKPRK